MSSLTKPGPGVDYIVTYSTWAQHDSPNADYLTFLAIKRAGSGLPPAPRYDGETSGKPIEAKVNLGIWMVDCEDCPASSCIEPDVPIFMCPKCDRSEKWRPVIMPANQAEIEEVLLMRPGFRESNKNRFWFPGETVEKLVDENYIHDAPVPAQHREGLKARITAEEAEVTALLEEAG